MAHTVTAPTSLTALFSLTKSAEVPLMNFGSV